MPVRFTGFLRSAFAAALASLLLAASPAAAQDAKAFYKGKTIRFVVGVGAGGGFDAYARMLAPLIEKELDATVVVHNQPGAGGMIALNSMYNASGDGLQLQMVNGTGAVLSQLLEDPSVRYDLTKISLLGVVTSSPWMWIRSPHSPMKTPADFMKPGAKSSWGGSGQLGGLSDGAAVTCEALKLTCRIVKGYDGSAQAALALARGEVDAMYVSDGSARNYVGSGGAIALLNMASTKSRFFPDVPSVYDALKLTDEQKWWLQFREDTNDLQRILGMPPNMPKEQLALMQQVVRKILTDPAVIADGEKTQRYIDYRSPEEVDKMIKTILVSITPEQKKRAKEVLLKE